MASNRNRVGEEVRRAKRSNNAVSRPFPETGLGKLPPEIREIIFISLIATPPSYAGHNFAISSAGPKNPASAQKKFVHIKASWHQVTQTCRQIYLESYPLFFASESYYLANPQEVTRVLEYGCVMTRSKRECRLGDLGCKHVMSHRFRRSIITTLCLEGFVTDVSLYTKEKIDKILSDPTDILNDGQTRQQLEAQTFKCPDSVACYSLKALPNLRTVGLRMLVGQEMEYVDVMYGISGMRRGLVEFVDQSHWLIRNQHPNDAWRIQYACFSMADYGCDKNDEHIARDRRCIEKEVTDIDSRAPGLQEGDERYVEVQIQRLKRDDDVETVSEVSDANTEDILRLEPSDLSATQVGELQDTPESARDEVEIELEEPSDLSATQVGELQDTPESAHDEVEIEVQEPFMEMEDDLQTTSPSFQDMFGPALDEVEIELEIPPLEIEDILQISPLENDLNGTELEQEVLNTAGPFGRSQSQDDYNSQSNEHPYEENDHALSETASLDFSGIQSTEPLHQQGEESLLPTYSKFAWLPVTTNTDSNRKFQTDSDEEDSNLQNKSRLGDQVPQSTQTEEDKAERHRRIRKRLLRQVQQPLAPFSNIPYPDIPEGVESFHMLQELVDLGINEQTETGVRESTQSSTTSSEMREHGIKSHGATSQKATSMAQQQVTAIPEWFWLLLAFVQIWTILLTYCYSCLLVIFLTASLQNLYGN